METLDSNASPNKRQKSETITLIPPISPSTKGKAPINTTSDDDDEIPAQSPAQICGICLSEGGKTVRGLIDSCDHYFCFLCIIEWSKIDSRCPLCRGRFSSIRRVRKDGTFIGFGSVSVPVRDQIYDPFGEFVDPYGQAKCSVCSGTKDECLLLLCDLCDSASHTYCVGLGATVPEDNWYCHDCDLLRAEQIGSGMDDNEETSAVPKQADEQENIHDEPETTDPVSVFDIVREPREPRRGNVGTDRLLKLVSLNPTKFSSSSIVSDHPSSSSERKLPGANGNLISHPNDRESSARTLLKSRDVHKHLSVLRENWDAFRTGSLNFSTKLSCPGGNVNQKIDEASISAKGSCQVQSTKSLQSKAQETSCDATQKEPSYNVQRAWKLMNAAKSLKQANKAKTASKSALKNTHDLKVGNIVSKCMLSAKKDLLCPKMGTQKPAKKMNESLARSSGEHQSCFASMATSASRSKYRNSCVPRPYTATEVQTMVQGNIYNNEPSLASCGKLRRSVTSAFFDDFACSTSSSGQLAGPSDVSCTNSQRQKMSTYPVKQVGKLNICVDGKDEAQISVQTDFCNDKGGLTSRANRGSCLSKISSDHHNSAHPFLQENVSGFSDTSTIKLKGKEVSEIPKINGAKISSKASKNNEAKDEIVSLVKLNLKLLCKEKRLESETFKEIARVSTHTILASCGFQHRDIVRSIPTLICQHDNQTQRLPRSALVPSSCRDCFYTFVKDVVISVLSEKMNNEAIAC